MSEPHQRLADQDWSAGAPAHPILKTRLFVPPTRPERVPRPTLIARLNEGLAGKLTLISAPSGFGKTTLMADWLQQLDLPFAWISLDEGDNDPVRLCAYVVAALQRIQPDVGQTAQAMLQAHQPPSQDPSRTITVVGIGEVSLVPDVAQVYVGAEARADTVSETKAEVDRQMAAIHAVLKEMAVISRLPE
jgi:hypothetical protein